MSELSAQLAAALPDNSNTRPEWLKALRETGAEQFRAHGLPTRKDEAWKYTALVKLNQAEIRLPNGSESIDADASLPSPLVESSLQLNLLDGQILKQTGDVPRGLTVLPLADALALGVDGLQTLLESLPGGDQKGASGHGFSALNSATLESGIVIHAAAGTDAGRLALSWSTSRLDKPLLFNSRVCVILEEGARLELLEQFQSTDDNANTSNIVMQADVGENAEFCHIRFQEESVTAGLITRTEVAQHANSEYAYYGFDLGGGLVRHELKAALLGNGAKSGLNGAYLLDGNRHVDNHVRVDHHAPAGHSRQYFRGVAGGSGKAVFNTAVRVHPGADGTEARQSNANILLSTRAEIDTKPELEIYADEVVASHGATVGQLDEKAVFYIRSRGLSEQEARQMLTMAFCRSVSDRLPDPALGEVISQRMMDVMPQAE
ncbi:MAG: Fe-S cluster assembly protein SufD [Lysobacterales bacterium]